MKNNIPNPHHHRYAIPSLFRAKMLPEDSAVVEAQDEGSTVWTPKWKRRSRNGRVPMPAKMPTALAEEAPVGPFLDLAAAKVLVQRLVQTRDLSGDPT